MHPFHSQQTYAALQERGQPGSFTDSAGKLVQYLQVLPHTILVTNEMRRGRDRAKAGQGASSLPPLSTQ